MSKLQDAQPAYTYDDFVLVPVYSDIKSRKDPDISTHVPNFQYDIPIVSAPMNTVTEADMLVTMSQLGGVGVLHRYMSVEDQLAITKEVYARLSDAGHLGVGSFPPTGTEPFYVAVGANGDFKERVKRLHKVGVKGFCVDVANGHNVHCLKAVEEIRRLVPDARIMAGNVCSFDGAYRLAEAGCNSIRVGVGPGAVCTTRQITGHGVPQLSAIEDCTRIKSPQEYGWTGRGTEQDYAKKAFPEVAIIADGGIRKPGDIVKALAIGADAVMIGSMLAGCQETPGDYIEEGDRLFKYYHGMASEEGREKWFDKSKVGLPSEGVSKKVPYVGRKASKIINGLCQSIKVGLSYSGARDIRELREKAIWMRQTGNGYSEGTPHGKM